MLELFGAVVILFLALLAFVFVAFFVSKMMIVAAFAVTHFIMVCISKHNNEERFKRRGLALLLSLIAVPIAITGLCWLSIDHFPWRALLLIALFFLANYQENKLLGKHKIIRFVSLLLFFGSWNSVVMMEIV